MIDSIAKTMSKLEKIVTDYHSDSDNSEKLNKRQKKRLKSLKMKEHESDDEVETKVGTKT